MGTTPDLTIEAMYGKLIEALADQHDSVAHAAQELLIEAVQRGIDPQSLNADGALLQFGLATISEVDGDDGQPHLEYEISPASLERDRVRALLLRRQGGGGQ